MTPRPLLLVAALLTIAAPAHAQHAAGMVRLEVQTSLGVITVEVDSAHAPRTAANFLRYVDGGHYREARFHRTVTLQNQDASAVKIEVIQASVAPATSPNSTPAASGTPTGRGSRRSGG